MGPAQAVAGVARAAGCGYDALAICSAWSFCLRGWRCPSRKAALLDLLDDFSSIDHSLLHGAAPPFPRLSANVQRPDTSHPTAQWTAQQLVEAFPFDTAPRYLLRDGDGVYGDRVRRRIDSLGIDEVVMEPASPWQNPYVERIIGTLRRELLDYVVALNERHLKQLLSSHLDYYHPWRTHQSLKRDAPDGRPICLAKPGEVIERPAVHGLHHCYLPMAA